MSWQRTVRHMRPDINCAPSQHRTINIDSMEVGFKIFQKKSALYFLFFAKSLSIKLIFFLG